MLKQALQRRPAEIVESLTKANLGLLERVGICSLAEQPDDMLMWSHYGSSHTVYV